jgi:hypothetical protein
MTTVMYMNSNSTTTGLRVGAAKGLTCSAESSLRRRKLLLSILVPLEERASRISSASASRFRFRERDTRNAAQRRFKSADQRQGTASGEAPCRPCFRCLTSRPWRTAHADMLAGPHTHVSGCRKRSPSTAAKSPTATTTPATMPPTTAPETPPPPLPLVPLSAGGSADAVLGGAGTGYWISGNPSAERSCACGVQTLSMSCSVHPLWRMAGSWFA